VTTDPYAALVVFAERERTLVDDGRVDELAALAAERDALIATLPPQAPLSARPALERAHALQLATAAALRASLAEVRHGLVALDRDSGVARAYAAGPQAPAAPQRFHAAA
jgi:hypothetical protein